MPLVGELLKEGLASRLRDPFRGSAKRASHRVARIGIINADVGPVAFLNRFAARWRARTFGRPGFGRGAHNSCGATLICHDEMAAGQQEDSNGRQTNVADSVNHASKAGAPLSCALEIRLEVLLKNREIPVT
jgi:hypothetical protein